MEKLVPGAFFFYKCSEYALKLLSLKTLLSNCYKISQLYVKGFEIDSNLTYFTPLFPILALF